MSECRFDEGDSVSIPAFGGICAEVLRKEQLGNGWQLWVRLPSGQELSVSCTSVGPCRRMAEMSVLDAAGDTGLGEETLNVERPLTFEQIDQGIRGTELFNRVRPGERHVMDTASEPETKLREIGRGYEMVRPILIAMRDSPFFRPAWRHALQIYIELMDSIFFAR